MRRLLSIVFSAILLLIVSAQGTWAQNNKVWDLGTYPGGTWATLGDINDLGVAVGFGDVPDGSTHPLAIHLLGPNAGKWIDLGTLGGTDSGWEEGYNRVSDTGVIVGYSNTAKGYTHGTAWTEKSGLVDLGTLADIGYSSYKASAASGVNKLGTLIVGWSGVEESCFGCAPSLPVVWTRSVEWKRGTPIGTWKIQKLDIAGADEGTTHWYPFNVNDLGQIVGVSNTGDGPVRVLWTPLPNGKGWKLTRLAPVSGYPNGFAYNINDRGEITGMMLPADSSVWVPVYWKPSDPLRKTYSQPIVLACPPGYASGYTDGINELGEMTGECWGDAGDQAVRWTTKDPSFSQVIGFPSDFSWSFGVNNLGIAVITYGGGNCTGATCAGAVRLH